MREVRRVLWALAMAAASCAPSPSTPVQVMAITQQKDGTYVPTQQKLTTIQDVAALRGSVATFLGDATITVDDNDPLLQQPNLTNAQIADIFLKGKGSAPNADYAAIQHVLWPMDFHSWNLVSTYYELEQAYAYWSNEVGVPPAELQGAMIYYLPTFTLVQVSPQPQVDDFLYFSPVQAFLLLPFQKDQLVPLGMNGGIVAHEYSHRVFNDRVYGGAAEPAPLIAWGGGPTTPAVNALRSVDEGLADFHAYGASCSTAYGCNARFLEPSLGTAAADLRDFTQPDKCMTQSLVDAMLSESYGAFAGAGLEYQVGTAFAAALYQAQAQTGSRKLLEQALLASYSDPSAVTPGLAQWFTAELNNPGRITLGFMANVIIQHISNTALQAALCAQLEGRLGLQQATDLPACPSSITPANTGCPAVSPY